MLLPVIKTGFANLCNQIETREAFIAIINDNVTLFIAIIDKLM